MYQVKKNKKRDGIVSTGYRWFSSAPLGYVTGRGNTVTEAAESLYMNLNHFSLKGAYYRPKSDFLSIENEKCILNRLKFLVDRKLISSFI
jgi:hypothetical protein